MPEGAYRDKVVQIVEPLKVRRGFNGIEVGVADGKTSERLLRAYPALRMNLVDPWAGGYAADHPYVLSGDGQASWSAEDKRLQCLRCVSRLKFAAGRVAFHTVTSIEGANRVPDGSVHFIFIDAIHTRENVLKDSAVWLWKLARNGIMIWHDYGNPNYPGVREAVELMTQNHGVDLQCDVKLFLAWATIR